MIWKLQAVVFPVSEETKFKVNATSIILNYLYYFGNVNKESFKWYYSQHTKPCKQNAIWQN